MINNMKGFTLVETLVAVLMLSLAIAGPLTIASKGLNATVVAKDQFVAFYLAQDAMEYVRFARDSACLVAGGGATGCPSNAWLSNLSPCVSTTGASSCYFDSLGTNPAVTTACSGACPVMRYDSTLKAFNYNISAPFTGQNFVRTVSIKNDPSGSSPDEALVTITVSWSDVAGVTHAPITIRESIFRWQ